MKSPDSDYTLAAMTGLAAMFLQWFDEPYQTMRAYTLYRNMELIDSGRQTYRQIPSMFE